MDSNPNSMEMDAPVAAIDPNQGVRQENADFGSAAAPAPKPAKELKVEDALHYLDQVKMEFSDKPHIYNEFLEIMKNFKAQTINTPGVIERVKNLFRGYNKLILGFNTFLPEGDGFKIELTAEEEAADFRESAGGAGAAGSAAMWTPTSGPASGLPAQVASVQAPAGGASGGAAQGVDNKPPQQVQQQHAISYVTTIRNRFQNEPDTYRAFLKILHTYQKEQKGIKDVLEQVSLLFADHPDLLMEFTYFLPDAVQGQAKERLNRAARESEMRRRQLQAQQQIQAQQMMGQAGQKRNAAGNRKQAQQYQQQMWNQQQANQAYQMQQQRNKQRRPRHGDIDSRSSHISQTAERRFFDNVKDILTSSYANAWPEFVKHMDLFVNDVISKNDFLKFAEDIFKTTHAYPEQFQELNRLMNARADYDAHSSDTYYAIPTSEIDFNQCRKCTPSYRSLPKDYPRPCCTERTENEQDALNDDWITFPYGHDGDQYTFKHMIKNAYEEELFKCEEDRFEIDMVIDSNYCTIRMLEPIAEEITAMKIVEDGAEGGAQSPRFSLQLEKRNLSVIHMNAISRLYGEHGPELLDLLHKNPSGTVPIVLKRLRQKDREWRKAREDLNVKWKDTIERNYEKSFDHRSYYFRRQDKRFYDAKQLIADIKESDKYLENSTLNRGVAALAHNQNQNQHQETTEGASSMAVVGQSDDGAKDMKLKAEIDAMNDATSYTNSFGKEGATTVGQMLASSTTVDIAEIDFTSVTRVYPSPEVLLGTPNSAGGSDAAVYPTAATAISSTINGTPLGGHGNRGVPLKELKGLKPQLNLRFPSKHHGIHKDIYGLFCHMAETQKLPSADHERVSSIWRDLLRVFLNLPVHYLYGDLSATAATVLEHAKGTGARAAAATAAAAGNNADMSLNNGMDVAGDNAGVKEDIPVSNIAGVSAAAIDAIPVDPSEAWAAGTRVITAYGCGMVLSFRAIDSMYVVGLPFGTAYVKPSNIIGAEQLSPSAKLALGITGGDNVNVIGVPLTLTKKKGEKGEKGGEKDANVLVYGQSLPTSFTYTGDPNANATAVTAGTSVTGTSNSSRRGGAGAGGVAGTIPPAASQTYNEPLSEPSKLLFSTPAGYLFMRMYHTIFTRLSAAKDLSDLINEKRAGVVTSGLGSGTGTMKEEPSILQANTANTASKAAAAADQEAQDSSELNNNNNTAPVPKNKRAKISIMQTSKQSKKEPEPSIAAGSSVFSAVPKAGFGGVPPGPQGLSKHPLSYLDASDEEARLVAGKGSPQPAYSAFYGQLLALLDGTVEQNKYEESCRLLLGNRSYVVFTMDKVISQCFKVLQQMANDEVFNKLVGLFVHHRSTTPHFKINAALCSSGGNYSHAASAAVALQAQTGAITPTTTATGATNNSRKSKGAAVPTANVQVPGTGHSTAIHNLEAWHAGAYGRTASMDPVPYLIHTAKLLANCGANDDVYRIQAITDPALDTFGKDGCGETCISIQYLGPLAATPDPAVAAANLSAACLGSPYPPLSRVRDIDDNTTHANVVAMDM